MNFLTEARDPSTGYRLRIDITDNSAWLVTDCCGASAKGTEWGIACRKCYNECDPVIGAYLWNLPGVEGSEFFQTMPPELAKLVAVEIMKQQMLVAS